MKRVAFRLFLTAILMLPFSSHAQNTLTVANGSYHNSSIPFALVSHPFGSQSIYPSSMLTNMVGKYIFSLHYYVYNVYSVDLGNCDNTVPISIKMMITSETSFSDVNPAFIDVTNATVVYEGTISPPEVSVGNGYTVELTTPFLYTGGNLLIIYQINPNGLNETVGYDWNGVHRTSYVSQSKNGAGGYNFTGGGDVTQFLPKTTFTYGPLTSCYKVRKLSFESENMSHNSILLTWSDTNNTGATYSIYDMSDTSLVQSGITDTFYNVTGLESNTEYTFAVRAVCGGGDMSAFSDLVTANTSCMPMALPWGTGFEENEIDGDDLTYALPLCCSRGFFSTPVFDPNHPRIYRDDGLTNYSHSGTQAMKLEGGNHSQDPIALLLPPVDVANYPMNANRLSFWARKSGYIYLYSCNGYELSNATLIDSVYINNQNNNTYTYHSVPLTGANPNDQYLAIAVKRGTSLLIDDIFLDEISACSRVLDVEIDSATHNSLSLSWTPNPLNSSATYSLYDMSDTTILASGIAGTSYTISGLNSNTMYTIGVQSNCPTRNSVFMTVAYRTDCFPSDCGTVTIPYVEDFEFASLTACCWTNDGPGDWIIDVGVCQPSGSVLMVPYSGEFNAKVCHTANNNATKFISPVIDNGLGLKLSFAHIQAMWGWEIDTLRVYYRSDINGDWNQVAEYFDISYGWTVDSVIINDSVYQVAFEMVDGYGWGVAIDKVVFDYNPNYPYMISISADSVTDSSVTISWVGNGTSFEVYGNASDSSASCVVNATQPPTYTFTGLAPATEYTFSVMAVKGSLKSNPISVTVVTDSAVVVPDSVWLTVMVNDTLMGTTIPEPGLYHVEKEDVVTFTAVPYEGYDFSSWDSGDTNAVVTFTVFEDTTITAIFVPKQTESIDDVEGVSINAYGKEGILVLHGATGREVYLYDLGGRLLYHTTMASETEQYVVPMSGSYLVRVVGVGTRKVVIVR